MGHAQVIHGLDRRFACHGLFEQVLGSVLRIGIQSENLAEIRLASARQPQAVILGLGMRLFMRVDLALAKPH